MVGGGVNSISPKPYGMQKIKETGPFRTQVSRLIDVCNYTDMFFIQLLKEQPAKFLTSTFILCYTLFCDRAHGSIVRQ